MHWSRDTIKIGLLYVAPGQENQREIFENEVVTASDSFVEFTNALGWSVSDQNRILILLKN